MVAWAYVEFEVMGASPDNDAEGNNVGAFGLNVGSKDSALLVTLQPGNYTAQITGVSGSTGLALVEVYEVP